MIAFNPTVMNKDAILLLPPYWFTLKETDLDSGREERKKKKRILETAKFEANEVHKGLYEFRWA